MNEQNKNMEESNTLTTSLRMPNHYFLYCASFMLYAASMVGIGPFIPYLAKQTGNKQTDYSYLFFCKSAGFFIGPILLKHFQKKLTFHSIMMRCFILLFVFMFLFTFFLNFIFQGIIMFFISTLASMINILVNVCVASSQKNGNFHLWMHILHGTYGIGGLISPILIYFFQLYYYLIIGILMLMMVPFCYKLQSPESNTKYYRQIVNPSVLQFQSYVYGSQNKNFKHKSIRKQSEYLLCFIFWAYIGIQLGFSNWISSYAVIQNVASKEKALGYVSIFWIAMTLFRFVSSFIPFKSIKKLMLHEYALIGFISITLFLILNDRSQIACILSSVSYGMCFSSMYPLLLSIPLDYNLQITSTQMTNIAFWSALGQATLALSFGLFMEWFFNDILFYIMFLMTLTLIFATSYLEQLYEKDSNKLQNTNLTYSIQLKQVLVDSRSLK